jgi:nitrite transporter NirC
MTEASVQAAAEAARTKAEYLRRYPLGYLILSALAGVYVGFGIVLIFAIGAPLLAAGSPAAKLAMGASFGIALSLVVFAGAELFTGNNMVMTIGALRRTATPTSLALIWIVSFAGNLLGSLALAWLVARSGVLGGAPHLEVIERTVATKMNLPFASLFWRAVLCNWLVCLGVWTAMRSQSDAGKLVMIFWCLFAFIGAGFEHSVANMTLLGIGLFQPHGTAVSVSGFVHNLVPVTLGNVVGGALFVGGAYWLANQPVRLPLFRPADVRGSVAAESAAGD